MVKTRSTLLPHEYVSTQYILIRSFSFLIPCLSPSGIASNPWRSNALWEQTRCPTSKVSFGGFQLLALVCALSTLQGKKTRKSREINWSEGEKHGGGAIMAALDTVDSILFSLSRAFSTPLAVFIQIQVCIWFRTVLRDSDGCVRSEMEVLALDWYLIEHSPFRLILF